MTTSNPLKLSMTPQLNYIDHKKTPPNVVIAGDFNLLDINWTNHQTTNNSTSSKHNKLLKITNVTYVTNVTKATKR